MKIGEKGLVEEKSSFDILKEIEKNSDTIRGGRAQKSEGDKDGISLSGRAIEIGELECLIAQLPEIRICRIKELKKAIDSGDYNIDSMKVAARILQEL